MADPDAAAREAATAPLREPQGGPFRVLLRISRPSAAVLAILWAALVWTVSSRPSLPIDVRSIAGSVLANLAHAPEFGILTLWLALAVPREGGRPSLRPRVIAKVLAAIAVYALVDEFHQSFTPHRDPSIFDVMTDLAGASTTLACLVAVFGPGAAPGKLVRNLFFGAVACLTTASLATRCPTFWFWRIGP